MGWETSARRARLPHNWRRIRAVVLRRDPTCRACGINASAEVDHIVAGDNHDPANLQGLCHDCHTIKTTAEAVAAQPRRARPAEAHPGIIG